MSTLLLRLMGPLQAWGTQSRFRERDTGADPSKSGILGIVCAALGKPRDERPDDGFPALADLAGLRLGVRVDSPGVMQADFQTAGGTHRRGDAYGVVKSSGSPGGTVVSRRYHLADASFLAGLEGDAALLRRIDAALARPYWQLCLGRKACVPAVPIRLPDAPPWGPGLRGESLEEALAASPWRGYGDRPDRLRLILDADPVTGTEVRRDVPLSFADRLFAPRHVRTEWLAPPERRA